jgi:cyclin-dependent kinase regulatory subunit CKS1
MENVGRISSTNFMNDVSRDIIQQIIRQNSPKIQYSDKYTDDVYEYRHVILTKELARILPKDRLMSEREWRSVGVQQSIGWEHYMIHQPEPHVLCFRRALPQ